jgi:pyrroline-5-carboxylate reductase
MGRNFAVGFVGSGNMSSAIIRGLIKKNVFKPEEICFCDVDQKKAENLAVETGAVQIESNVQLAKESRMVVLGIKPSVLLTILGDIGDYCNHDTLVISVAAGINIATIRSFLPRAPIVRAMPNTPSLVGEGMTAYSMGLHTTTEHEALTELLFQGIGQAIRVDESMMDAVTGLSGSGPAYCFVMMEAMADAGVHAGLPRRTAVALAAQTLAGAARMVQQTGDHPGILKDMVTSPGGTTIEGIRVLERGGFRGTVMAAVLAAIDKAKALTKSNA